MQGRLAGLCLCLLRDDHGRGKRGPVLQVEVARLVDLAAEGVEDVAGAAGVRPIGVVARALEYCGHRRLGCREFACEARDGVRLDAANAFRPRGRVSPFPQVGAKPLEALAIVRDEVAVVEVLLDDHAAHCQCHRTVGSRANRHPLVGFLRGLGEAGVDHHQARTLLRCLDQGAALPEPLVGAKIVHAPQDHVARVREVVHRKHVPEERETGGAAILLAARGVGVVVRRPVEIAEQVPEEDGVGVMVAGVCHRLGTPFVANRDELVRDERESLVPRNALELPRLTLGVGAQHRVLEAVGIARQVGTRHAFRAARADVVRRFGVALVVHDLSVAYEKLGRALPRARVAEALDQLGALHGSKPGSQVVDFCIHWLSSPSGLTLFARAPQCLGLRDIMVVLKTSQYAFHATPGCVLRLSPIRIA